MHVYIYIDIYQTWCMTCSIPPATVVYVLLHCTSHMFHTPHVFHTDVVYYRNYKLHTLRTSGLHGITSLKQNPTPHACFRLCIRVYNMCHVVQGA